jgi:hypothetical protein
LYLVAAFLIVAGCQPPQQKKAPVCPGKSAAADALSALSSQAQKAVPLKATGQCILEYYVEGKKHRENFPIKLWVNPPVEVYLQGEVAFDPRGLVLGSNESEFWLAVKPDEISSYWWGLWSEESYNERLMISPKIVLEALGIVALDSSRDSEANWSLSKERSFDVLTKSDDEGRPVKKIYIDTCDYLVRKIEQLINGTATVVAELQNYKELAPDVFVPVKIKVANVAGANKGDSVAITLQSIKTAEFSEKLRSRLFIRPDYQGFKHIYRVIGGSIIEQH